jgi:hypothetical protein
MKRAMRSYGGYAVAAVVWLCAGPASGQVSRETMLGWSKPPVTDFLEVKSFQYVGDYGYYLASDYATRPEGHEDHEGHEHGTSDLAWYRYTGTAGKRTYIYAAWGTTPIPPPGVRTDGVRYDNCGHAHVSYGVWARETVKKTIPFGTQSSRWVFFGGGSQVGERLQNGTCRVSIKNPYTAIPGLTWGEDFLSVDGGVRRSFGTTRQYTELVIGAQANTHGWGTCENPTAGCFEPVYVIAYTLPR